jgi:hypothetical protein
MIERDSAAGLVTALFVLALWHEPRHEPIVQDMNQFDWEREREKETEWLSERAWERDLAAGWSWTVGYIVVVMNWTCSMNVIDECDAVESKRQLRSSKSVWLLRVWLTFAAIRGASSSHCWHCQCLSSPIVTVSNELLVHSLQRPRMQLETFLHSTP